MGALEHIGVALLNTLCVAMLVEEPRGFLRTSGILINGFFAVLNGALAYNYMVTA